jgi:hypothetical protein
VRLLEEDKDESLYRLMKKAVRGCAWHEWVAELRTRSDVDKLSEDVVKPKGVFPADGE